MDTLMENGGPMAKRLFDLAVALTIAPVAGLLCLGLAILIYREDRANPFFRQTRVGRDGTPFTLLKMRTMQANTPHLPSHEVSIVRVTRVGAMLRRTKLDELPQLWNVIVGDMSFVGPRPCLPSQGELIAARAAAGVAGLRPGITGPAQVRGLDMSEPARLARADAAYLGRWTLRRDLQLLVATAFGHGRGDAVR